LFDHAIYKMPRGSTITPWHQDQAYLGKVPSVRSLHFWIPLQDTNSVSGCLRFVPGSHKNALLPHASAYVGNPHVLSVNLDAIRAVDVPLHKGDVSIHTSLTLHSAGANRSDAIRKAWIIHFGDKPRWFKHLMKARDLLAVRALRRAGVTRRS